jgi:hypothetical protein
MSATITILSPVPEPVAEAAVPAAAWDLPRRVRVGMLANGKPNTDHLLDGVLEVLAADPRVVPAVRIQKRSASRGAEQEVLDGLAVASDLVVGATAD